MNHKRVVSVLGLGYVGLPLALAFAKEFAVIAYDKDLERIKELQAHHDRTKETSSEELQAASANLTLTADASDLQAADFHVIAVPTPIDSAKQPDLSLLRAASTTIGEQLKPGTIVVYESTVYPGVTEDVCLPILAKTSGLKPGIDFTVAYSPERINPGDKEHRLTDIVKVVAGQDEKTLDIVSDVYGKIIKAGLHKAPSIKVAEAAKVIENTQRDLNIALMNELALIFQRMGINTQDVLAAAGSKWNFLPFKPGLVGGHCIGVDPYYLTYQAQKFGYHPEVILAGRRINDGMGEYIARESIKQMLKNNIDVKTAKVAIMGLTFKEDCPDLRNSKVEDIVNELKDFDVELYLHDPEAEAQLAASIYQQELVSFSALPMVDVMIIAVGHQQYKTMQTSEWLEKLNPNGLIMDIKSILNPADFSASDINIWSL